jgi:hypothetical protein
MGVIRTVYIDEAPYRIKELHARLLPLLAETSRDDTYIAGGCIRDAFAGHPAKDIDLFFPTETAWRGAMGALMPAMCRFVNNNAVGLTLPGFGDVDVCRASFKEPQAMLEDFDFIACCAALTRQHYLCHVDFEADVCDRALRINNPANATTGRADRLMKRGWHLGAGESVRLRATEGRSYP